MPREAKRCLIIGLTGSSGSGKSEAAKILSGHGASVIDADAISHEVAERRETLDELSRAFGAWVIDKDGRFNRGSVSERAFSDGEFLAALTAITHKYIVNEIYERVDKLKAEGCGIIVIDAPIPVKKGFLDISDVVWVVKSPRSRRLQRVVERDGIGLGAAEARFASQLPDDEYDKLADAVILNDGNLQDLADELSRRLRMLSEA